MWISKYLNNDLVIDSVLDSNYNMPIMTTNLKDTQENVNIVGVSPLDIYSFVGENPKLLNYV